MCAEQHSDAFFLVRLSYVELYNNSFRNLLEFASGMNSELASKGMSPSLLHPGLLKSGKIEVRESKAAGVFLAGENLRIPVTSAHEASQLIARGNRQRTQGATNCNEHSSRSHAILTIHVESRFGAGDLRIGKLHLVDLAGR